MANSIPKRKASFVTTRPSTDGPSGYRNDRKYTMGARASRSPAAKRSTRYGIRRNSAGSHPNAEGRKSTQTINRFLVNRWVRRITVGGAVRDTAVHGRT